LAHNSRRGLLVQRPVALTNRWRRVGRTSDSTLTPCLRPCAPSAKS